MLLSFEWLLLYCHMNSLFFSLESSEQVLKLYQCYQHLADALNDKASSAAAAGPSSNKRGASAVPSRLSLHCVVRLLRAIFQWVNTLGCVSHSHDNLYSNQTPNHQQALTVLRESQPFGKYILGVAVQKIHQVSGFENALWNSRVSFFRTDSWYWSMWWFLFR